MQSFYIEIKGLVQGIGFRPFVVRIAKKYKLNGWVCNDSAGVQILCQGLKSSKEKIFLEELRKNSPSLAKITSIDAKKIEHKDKYKDFFVKKSKNTSFKKVLISPDIGICPSCKNELRDKKNPRYAYSLINCTACGPRFSIIKSLPYDRQNTSMDKFAMCKACDQEYQDINNKRYHAQPISCEACGPNINLYQNYKKISKNLKAIEKLAMLIKEGELVIIKAYGGYQILCDSKNDESIARLRTLKQRPLKPFALMCKNLKQAKDFTYISKEEENISEAKEGAIVLLRNKGNNKLSNLIAPNIKKLGLCLAYSPIYILLFDYLESPIIFTSANLKSEPIIYEFDTLKEKFQNKISYILDINREIVNPCDDSVLMTAATKKIINIKQELRNQNENKEGNQKIFLRISRGFAPCFLNLNIKNIENFKNKNTKKNILSIGANSKLSISLVLEDKLLTSAELGSMNNLDSKERFIQSLENFIKLYDFKIELMLCDMHPDYESTKFAKQYCKNKNIDLIQVYHHHAHILAVMAEYSLDKKVLGIAFDGTGYGVDGNIWGGEFLLSDTKKFERVFHFKYFKLLGSENAIKEPRRIALALLFESLSLEKILKIKNNTCLNSFEISEIKIYHLMWKKGINSPLCSSVGRLFDAVFALGGFAISDYSKNYDNFLSYEAQSGLMIEKYYDENINQAYEFNLDDGEINLDKMFLEILEDKENKIKIASKFINTLALVIYRISFLFDSYDVVLAGGVFQNSSLLKAIYKKFYNEKSSKKIYFPQKISVNDSSISIGQAYFGFCQK